MPSINLNKEMAVVILAAGAGSRMGKIKQLLPGSKRSFLEEIIEKAMKLETSNVFVTIGAHAETIKPRITHFPVEIIINKNWQKGLGNSIAFSTGYIMEFSKEINAILFVLVDQPLIDLEYYKQLINKYIDNKKNIVCSNYNNTPGVPAVFGKMYFKDLNELTGDVGAKKILMANIGDVELLEEQNNLLDIDNLDDYSDYLNSI
ncbi:nucleotidyltransferase family protein [Namhaeicola litoreus]|uniref:NTP transferase domain-containing protein n=1 Tax=Namhaeicola litoreus TaxID=1052145 RepID=A0ABW3Y473_9FLAO